MAAPPCSSSLISLSSIILYILLSAGHAQSVSHHASSGPISITRILKTAGQYTDFIRLLNQTRVTEQIDNQVNNSHDGLTIFAPTDNAFNNLPAGTLNLLTDQQQVQLVLYHICPKFYSLFDLETVSNPVRTQASGQDGGVYGLYFSGTANQVNVSNGYLAVPINIALRKEFPLAVYQLDSVLLLREFSKAHPPAPPVHIGDRRGGASGRDGVIAVAPYMGNPAWNGAGNPEVAPSAGNTAGNGARKRALAPTKGNPAVSPVVAPSAGNPAGNGARKRALAPTKGNPAVSPVVAPSAGNPAGNGARKRALAPTKGNPAVSPVVAPSTGNPAGNGAGRIRPEGLELVRLLWLLSIGILPNLL